MEWIALATLKDLNESVDDIIVYLDLLIAGDGTDCGVD